MWWLIVHYFVWEESGTMTIHRLQILAMLISGVDAMREKSVVYVNASSKHRGCLPHYWRAGAS